MVAADSMDNVQDYSLQVLDHYENPRNAGELDDADGIGVVGDPSCGDVMKVTIRVKDDIILQVKFKTFGCGAAIAASSMATEMVIGKSIAEALGVTDTMVIDALGGLPKAKRHCSNLANEAVKAAIFDYQRKHKRIKFLEYT